ncbi:MAG: lysophospholipid acyltransferase family protein [Verrucomicrobiaceae bacterium]
MRSRFKHSGILFSWIIRIVCRTLWVDLTDHAGVARPDRREPVICAFWHDRIFMLPWIRKTWCENMPCIVLSSASRDGQIITDVCSQFGLEAARGSSSKPEKGLNAVIELATKMKAGFDVGITPDGPRGPRHTINPGLLKLAQITGKGILPVHIQFEKYWQLKTWDRFIVPKPFSHVHVTLDKLITIPRGLDKAEFEEHRQNLEDQMRAAAEPA